MIPDCIHMGQLLLFTLREWLFIVDELRDINCKDEIWWLIFAMLMQRLKTVGTLNEGSLFSTYYQQMYVVLDSSNC